MMSYVFSAAGKRFLLPALLLWLAGASALSALESPKVFAAYREAQQFYRISEFFTGRENTGRNVILRSNPEERGGFYWTVRLRSYPYRKQVEEAVRLEVILPGDVEPTLFTFALGPERPRNPLILVGLTGDHWADPDALPLAWRISFADAAGDIFARQQSFLWSTE